MDPEDIGRMRLVQMFFGPAHLNPMRGSNKQVQQDFLRTSVTTQDWPDPETIEDLGEQA